MEMNGEGKGLRSTANTNSWLRLCLSDDSSLFTYWMRSDSRRWRWVSCYDDSTHRRQCSSARPCCPL